MSGQGLEPRKFNSTSEQESFDQACLDYTLAMQKLMLMRIEKSENLHQLLKIIKSFEKKLNTPAIHEGKSFKSLLAETKERAPDIFDIVYNSIMEAYEMQKDKLTLAVKQRMDYTTPLSADQTSTDGSYIEEVSAFDASSKPLRKIVQSQIHATNIRYGKITKVSKIKENGAQYHPEDFGLAHDFAQFINTIREIFDNIKYAFNKIFFGNARTLSVVSSEDSPSNISPTRTPSPSSSILPGQR